MQDGGAQHEFARRNLCKCGSENGGGRLRGFNAKRRAKHQNSHKRPRRADFETSAAFPMRTSKSTASGLSDGKTGTVASAFEHAGSEALSKKGRRDTKRSQRHGRRLGHRRHVGVCLAPAKLVDTELTR